MQNFSSNLKSVIYPHLNYQDILKIMKEHL